jgi:hypothetical protein
MTVPTSGQDSLQVRRAYFREHRSRHVGDWGLSAVWVFLGAIVSWVFVAGFTGPAH